MPSGGMPSGGMPPQEIFVIKVSEKQSKGGGGGGGGLACILIKKFLTINFFFVQDKCHPEVCRMICTSSGKQITSVVTSNYCNYIFPHQKLSEYTHSH